MKPTKILLSALSLLLATAITGQATESASWGTVKNASFVSPAAKSTGRAVSQTFDANGGELEMSESLVPGTKDNLSVEFSVPPGALTETVEITMTVHGNTLSDLVVAFQPGGLVFLKNAKLEVQVGTDRIDINTSAIQVEHIYSDGYVEQATVTGVDRTGKANTRIWVAIPGFSRYSMGGGGP